MAFYTSGTHGVVGESSTHTGTDIAMAAGNSGNFQQWFIRTSGSSPDADHSVWKIRQDNRCPNGWILVVDAQQSWGSYLNPGNYCVKTNNFWH